MNHIAIPLQLNDKGLLRSKDLRESIDSSLSLLIQTACYSCPADPEYGFVLKYLRFEIFDENDGTVYNSQPETTSPAQLQLYKKKISGTSRNIDTFAAELKDAIAHYESRLQDVSATLTYIREEKRIYISVKGIIAESGDDYQYQTTIKVWN